MPLRVIRGYVLRLHLAKYMGAQATSWALPRQGEEATLGSGVCIDGLQASEGVL